MQGTKRRERENRPCDQCRENRCRCDRDAAKKRCLSCEEQNRECTFLRGPMPRKIKNDQTSPIGAQPSTSKLASPVRPKGRAGSSLDKSLGLRLHLHSEYIGPSSYHEPSLLELKPSASHPPAKHDCRLRQFGGSTAFMIHTNEDSAFEVQRIAELDRIEATVQPLGPTLVKLYFHIVHPTFPVLQKDAFLAKYARSYREISPPLLAAVYLLALDWQLFDRALSASKIPDVAVLENLAMRAMDDDLTRPKLSTLQAGLLLLQRVGRTKNTLLAQLVALGHALGIHVDCSDWAISKSEKGLRRRLAWTLYMQDKWGVLVHGRPSLIPDRIALNGDKSDDTDWDVRPCTMDDFPETSTNADDGSYGSVDVEIGRSSFLHSIELTKIFSQIQYTFCSVGATRKGGRLDRLGAIGITGLANPFAQQLREWYIGLPDGLKLNTSSHVRRLSASGALHLSHMAAELTLHRALLRALGPDTPPSLRFTIRAASRARLLSALSLVETLQPEHTQSFWGFAASAQMAMIGSFAGLLWATSVAGDEAIEYANVLERLRWALQVRGSAVPFVREALRMIHEEIGDLGVFKDATYTDLP
ncbi:fungal-specific transcription factor domain-containing protein [Aspergillus steynii IBT 23096]|uniref:Fungal-specific transcription factor domain-containing protein n=1 Tax=Aspergillus steynii IBT 23096 TaxID=1392250 RepID=A0A2I2FV98_9EURO|nr:fungal-specific transcription factor domain-containing protein [Aspergillus steynii IBT 23096]PLB44527.1 fungal-specific transcription factor domain-containing protein [Aspergillus steynii IBT 23096]